MDSLLIKSENIWHKVTIHSRFRMDNMCEWGAVNSKCGLDAAFRRQEEEHEPAVRAEE